MSNNMILHTKQFPSFDDPNTSHSAILLFLYPFAHVHELTVRWLHILLSFRHVHSHKHTHTLDIFLGLLRRILPRAGNIFGNVLWLWEKPSATSPPPPPSSPSCSYSMRLVEKCENLRYPFLHRAKRWPYSKQNDVLTHKRIPLSWKEFAQGFIGFGSEKNFD